MEPWNKSLNSIFPTKYVIPKSLKFSHWPSKTTHIWSFPNSCEVPSNWPTKTSLKLTAGTPRLEYITIFNRKYIFNPGPFSIAIFSLPECGVPGCTMRWSFFFLFWICRIIVPKIFDGWVHNFRGQKNDTAPQTMHDFLGQIPQKYDRFWHQLWFPPQNGYVI